MEEQLHSPEDQERVCDDLSQTEQRALLVQLLYAVDAFEYHSSLQSVVDNFARGFHLIIPVDSALFKKAEAIIEERQQLDQVLTPLIANWRVDRLGVVTRIILRIALWELAHTAIDRLVIINEAVELAKCFAEKDAYKFINGVLDEYYKREAGSEEPDVVLS